jgi:hypothetical protein
MTDLICFHVVGKLGFQLSLYSSRTGRQMIVSLALHDATSGLRPHEEIINNRLSGLRARARIYETVATWAQNLKKKSNCPGVNKYIWTPAFRKYGWGRVQTHQEPIQITIYLQGLCIDTVVIFKLHLPLTASSEAPIGTNTEMVGRVHPRTFRWVGGAT